MELLEKLEIPYKNVKLYERALTHTSFANENAVKSYERLEFLGDTVLDLVISDYLYKNTEYEEGKMTKYRSHYVCENANFEYSTRLGLNEYLRLGHGEEERGGKYRKAIVADIFESFIGAMYLDLGYDEVKKFIYKHIIPLIEDKTVDFFDDYKSVLQELVQTDKKSLEYVVIDEQGPAHDKTFTVEVKIDNIVYGEGTAHSKKEAEQIAAKDALKKAQNGNFNKEER
ncbi:MAG: ribonuclease III [Firmicutes bacterium]|nr:ribonuclease III [Bacillota bacterium]